MIYFSGENYFQLHASFGSCVSADVQLHQRLTERQFVAEDTLSHGRYIITMSFESLFNGFSWQFFIIIIDDWWLQDFCTLLTPTRKIESPRLTFPPRPCESSGASCGESVDDPTSQVQHLMSSAESGSDRWYFHSLCWPRDAVVLLHCSVLFVSPVSPGIHLPFQAAFGQSAAAATELIRVEDEGGLTCVWKDMSQWSMTQWWYTTQWYYHHRACCLCLWLFELLFIHPFSMAVPGRVPPWTSCLFIGVSQRRTNKQHHTQTATISFFQFTSHALWEEASYSYFGGQSSFIIYITYIKFSADILWFPSKQFTAVQ